MSAQPETPCINYVVEHLQELEIHMKSDPQRFSDREISNMDQVITSLHDLDQRRIKLHDELEIETIRTCRLRNTLRYLPQKNRDEITKAVNSVRLLNADTLEELKKKAAVVEANIDCLKLYIAGLKNIRYSHLIPCKKAIEDSYAEIIDTLNNSLAKKTHFQIVLNEIRDQVREENQKIYNLECEAINVKEMLIGERKFARIKKKETKEVKEKEEKKKLQQMKINEEKDLELDKLLTDLSERSQKIEHLEKEVDRLELSSRNKEELSEKLLSTISTKTKEKNDIRRKSEQILDDTKQAENKLKDRETKMQKMLSEIEKKIEIQLKKKKTLEGEKNLLKEEYINKLEASKGLKREITAADDRLQKMKESLAKKAEQLGQLNAGLKNMQEEMMNTAMSNQNTIAELCLQLGISESELNLKTEERIMTEKEKETTEISLEKAKTESSIQHSEMTEAISEQKSGHASLVREGEDLQDCILDAEDTIKKLQDEVDSLLASYYKQETEKNAELEPLREEIDELEEAIASLMSEMEEQLPNFDECKNTLEMKREELQDFKKHYEGRKNCKNSLESEIKKAIAKRVEILKPHEHLKQMLKQVQKSVLEQMRLYARETHIIEKNIYAEGCKLKRVVEENEKLKMECGNLEENIITIQTHRKVNKELEKKLRDQILLLKERLSKGFITTKKLEEESEKRDQTIVDEFSVLIQTTQAREKKLSNVSSSLYEKLNVLSDYLKRVMFKRPKDESFMQETTADSQHNSENKGVLMRKE